MYKVVSLILLSMFSIALYADGNSALDSSDTDARELPVILNLGLSSYAGNGLGVYIELPVSKHFSATAGLGHYGGFSVGAKFYKDLSTNGPYVGIGYGMVEFEETYVEEESRWKEDLEYGSFFTIGYRFLNNSGNFFNAGLGLYHRPEKKDEYYPEETEGGNLGFALDLTYGITF
jgi:hypothetical protein